MDRRIKATKRDRNGNIIALCNPGESWSPRRTADVIKDISNNVRSYYVQQVERRITGLLRRPPRLTCLGLRERSKFSDRSLRARRLCFASVDPGAWSAGAAGVAR
jgi:hypothetical protein